ncbi:MAG: hypothetical protein KDK27_09725 [Leptospiraceae bacterium]|nr:hypothetical protein [Leptospiraceae bacterium]
MNAIDVIALEAELVAIDNAVRMEVDQYEFVRSDELTRKERQAHLTSPVFPMERDAAMDKMRIALVNGGFSQSWKDGPTLKKSARININTTSAAVVFENLRVDFSAALLSYYSIRNGYVRRGVPDTTNNTARLTSSISPLSNNVRFNALYSAHSRDFHTDNLKFQRTITTGVIHRAVELCPFEKRRV